MPRVLILCVTLSIGCFVTVGTYLASHQSASYDEVADLGSGYAFLRGNWRLDPDHLPMTKALAAWCLPAALSTLPVPAADASMTTRSYAHWEFGNKLLHRSPVKPLVSLRAARTPIIWLNALLIPLVALFTYRLGGLLAASLATLLISLEPLWIAHATIVGSDATAGVFLFASAFAAHLLVHGKGNTARVGAIGLCVCAILSIATKYYSPLGLCFVWIAAAVDAKRLGSFDRLTPLLLGTGAVSLVLGIALAWGWPPGFERYLYGYEHLGRTFSASYDYYAFGDLFHTRHRLYFVQALAVKASVTLLVLTGVWVVLRLRKSSRSSGDDGAAVGSTLLWLPPLGHLVIMSLVVLPLGARYMLSVLPFMFLFAGLAAGALWQRSRARWLVPLLACMQLWAFGVALRSSPLAYFNGLGCYTGQIPSCLDDSNVDWGHALPALNDALKQRYGSAEVRIAYFGSSPVEAYLDNARSMQAPEWYQPYRALYAISLHILSRNSVAGWTRTTSPVAVIGGAYALYDLRANAALPLPGTTIGHPSALSSRR